MNIQAINLKSTKRRRQATAKATFAGKIYIVAGFLLIFVIVAFCLNYRTWLNKNIARIDKQTAYYRRKIHDIDREIEDLRIRKESLSNWTHIQDRITVLKLNLRLARPAQFQALVVNFSEAPARTRKAPASSRKLALASLEFARDQACPLKLEVHAENLPAINLCKSLGFEVFENYNIYMILDPGSALDRLAGQ